MNTGTPQEIAFVEHTLAVLREKVRLDREKQQRQTSPEPKLDKTPTTTPAGSK